MARYTGPVCRTCRRAGEKLFLKGERCFSPKCGVERKPNPPGEHGANRRRRLSEHAIQLREKMRARAIYGVLERQFAKYFDVASKKPGMTGQYLLQLLERRLDNVVFRLGFADSRAQARQITTHGLIAVNGRGVSVPSYSVQAGDVIGWREGAKKTTYFKSIAEDVHRKPLPKWLSLDAQAMTGKVNALPETADMDLKIDERLIVEFYAR